VVSLISVSHVQIIMMAIGNKGSSRMRVCSMLADVLHLGHSSGSNEHPRVSDLSKRRAKAFTSFIWQHFYYSRNNKSEGDVESCSSLMW